MRTCVWLWLLAFGLGVGLIAALPAGAADKATPEQIAKLVEMLGSSEFTDREKATKELEALGDQAIDALKKAVAGDDLETKRRAEELLKKAEGKAFTKKVLEPTKIRLNFKDTPLKDAVAEVTKKTGLNIQLIDPENKMADRKVTLDTGETTLWEAVDLFVQKAGLVEAVNPTQVIGPGGIREVPVPLPLPAPNPPIKRIQILPVQPVQPVPPALPPGMIQVQFGGQAQAQPAQPAQPVPALKPGRVPVGGFIPNTLVLNDGKSEDMPTHYAGAVRIRALPQGTQVPGFQAQDGELAVPLQVTPEPKLQILSLVNVRVDKAVDDQDQTLLQATADAGGNNDEVPAANGIARARFVARPPVMGGLAPVAVRLKKGDKAAKTLKELSGVVSVQMRTAPEAILTVEKLMDAAGKEVKNENGGRLKIIEVTKDDKATTLKVEFQPSQDVQPGGFGGGFGGGGIQILPVPLPAPQPVPPQQQNQIQVQILPAPAVPPPQVGGGPVAGVPGFAGGYNGLTVQDEKGNSLPLQPTNAQVVGKGGNGVVWQYTFTIPTQKDQGAPAKLVYSGTKLVTVDIPFTLKNVPVQ